VSAGGASRHQALRQTLGAMQCGFVMRCSSAAQCGGTPAWRQGPYQWRPARTARAGQTPRASGLRRWPRLSTRPG
jgi:hypothetical protein